MSSASNSVTAITNEGLQHRHLALSTFLPFSPLLEQVQIPGFASFLHCAEPRVTRTIPFLEMAANDVSSTRLYLGNLPRDGELPRDQSISPFLTKWMWIVRNMDVPYDL